MPPRHYSTLARIPRRKQWSLIQADRPHFRTQNAFMKKAAGMADRRWRATTAGPAIMLALLSLAALAAAPLGWRAGWLGLGPAFALIALAGLLAILGALLAIVALFAVRPLGRLRLLLLSLAVALGAGFVLMPLQLWSRHAPAIHDITTDTVDPPAIVAALATRDAEHAASAAYGGANVAAAQRAAYPDIAPLLLPLLPGKAFDLALATARGMPRWRIVASDPATGRIEASEASFWFDFVDDIVLRVSAEGAGSRIDIRSLSRQGRGDLGVNAARVRAYLAALKSAAS